VSLSVGGWGELGPHLMQWGLSRGLPPYTKWRLDPSNHFVTIHQCHGLWSDSTMQTVLQMVAQNGSLYAIGPMSHLSVGSVLRWCIVAKWLDVTG